MRPINKQNTYILYSCVYIMYRTRYIIEIVKVGKDGSRTWKTGSLFPGAPTTRPINCILREKHGVPAYYSSISITSVACEFIFGKRFHRVDESVFVNWSIYPQDQFSVVCIICIVYIYIVLT